MALMRSITVCTLLSFLVIVSGCKEEVKTGTERVVGKTPSATPSWVVNRPDSDKDYFYFIGETESGSSAGVRDAYQIAVSKITQYIKQRASQVYEGVEKNLGRKPNNSMREQLIRNISKNTIQGAKEEEVYWEKVEKTTTDGVEYFYKVYSLVSFPKENINDSFSDTKDMVSEKKTEEALEMTRKRLMKELEEYN